MCNFDGNVCMIQLFTFLMYEPLNVTTFLCFQQSQLIILSHAIIFHSVEFKQTPLNSRKSYVNYVFFYLFQKVISRKLLTAGDESRLLMPFSEWCGDTDLLRCLTEGRADESSLDVGLGARLDGMLILLILDMKSSPRTSSSMPNHCRLWKQLDIFNFRQTVTSKPTPTLLQMLPQTG